MTYPKNYTLWWLQCIPPKSVKAFEASTVREEEERQLQGEACRCTCRLRSVCKTVQQHLLHRSSAYECGTTEKLESTPASDPQATHPSPSYERAAP